MARYIISFITLSLFLFSGFSQENSENNEKKEEKTAEVKNQQTQQVLGDTETLSKGGEANQSLIQEQPLMRAEDKPQFLISPTPQLEKGQKHYVSSINYNYHLKNYTTVYQGTARSKDNKTSASFTLLLLKDSNREMIISLSFPSSFYTEEGEKKSLMSWLVDPKLFAFSDKKYQLILGEEGNQEIFPLVYDPLMAGVDSENQEFIYSFSFHSSSINKDIMRIRDLLIKGIEGEKEILGYFNSPSADEQAEENSTVPFTLNMAKTFLKTINDYLSKKAVIEDVVMESEEIPSEVTDETDEDLSIVHELNQETLSLNRDLNAPLTPHSFLWWEMGDKNLKTQPYSFLKPDNMTFVLSLFGRVNFSKTVVYLFDLIPLANDWVNVDTKITLKIEGAKEPLSYSFTYMPFMLSYNAEKKSLMIPFIALSDTGEKLEELKQALVFQRSLVGNELVGSYSFQKEGEKARTVPFSREAAGNLLEYIINAQKKRALGEKP